MPITARERNETGAAAVTVAEPNVLKGIEK